MECHIRSIWWNFIFRLIYTPKLQICNNFSFSTQPPSCAVLLSPAFPPIPIPLSSASEWQSFTSSCAVATSIPVYSIGTTCTQHSVSTPIPPTLTSTQPRHPHIIYSAVWVNIERIIMLLLAGCCCCRTLLLRHHVCIHIIVNTKKH